jgi:hypothetical protein
MGWVLFLAGLALVAGTVLHLLGLSEALGAYVRARPWPAFLSAGIVLATWGVGYLRSARTRSKLEGAVAFLVFLPARIVGLILLLAGLASFAAGGYELLRPADFDARVERIRRSLPQPPELPDVTPSGLGPGGVRGTFSRH